MGAHDFLARPALVSTIAKMGSGLRDYARNTCSVRRPRSLVSALPRSSTGVLATQTHHILMVAQKIMDARLIEGLLRVLRAAHNARNLYACLTYRITVLEI